MVLALVTSLVAVVLLVAALVAFFLYVHSGRAAGCQTNAIARHLDADVNGLLKQVRAGHHVIYPAPDKAPPGC